MSVPSLSIPNSSKGRVLIMITGFLFGLLGLILAWASGWDSASLGLWLSGACLAGGLVMVILASVLHSGRILGGLFWIVVNGWVFAGLMLAGEGVFRLVGHDFEAIDGRTRDKRDAYPLCFQLPDQPLPEVFFQRAGPAEWTGRPLGDFLRARRGADRAYEDEKPFTLEYDSDGFRNPAELRDWDVVVAGDSFVESGFLPEDQHLTAVAARESGLRVRNLGQVNTGTYAQVRFLRRFGGAPSCRRSVLVFYDGNDVIDAEQEWRDLKRNRKDGWRPSRVPVPQRSLTVAVYRALRAGLAFAPPRTFQDAWLISGGREQPITLRPAPMPVDPSRMTEDQSLALEQALSEFAAAASSLGLAPTLLYLPSNNRTYHGLLRFSERVDPQARDWVPGDLPDWVRERCKRLGIGFVDACPALREAAERGVLVYNPILDTHLNAEGSRIVGQVLAAALKGPDDANPARAQAAP
jgi:hypothetical protein